MPAFSLGTVGSFAVTLSTIQTIVASKTFQASAAAAVPVTVQGTTSQTGNLQEWRNIGNTLLGRVNSVGGFALSLSDQGMLLGAIGNGSDNAAGLMINYSSAATIKPLVIRTAASQTANMTEWQNSAGTVLTYLRNDGAVFGPLFAPTRTNGSIRAFVGTHETEDTGIGIYSLLASSRVLLVRGVASQTGSLQEWQSNTGVVLTQVGPTGTITIPGTLQLRAGQNGIDNGEVIHAFANGTGVVPIIAQGFAGQAANLAEFRNSAGTVFSSISQDGILSARSININNLFSGFQPVLYLTAHASQSANIQEWRNSAGTVISRVLSNGSFEMNGISSGIVAATLVNSSNLGTAAGSRTYIAKIFTQTSNATGFYIDAIRSAAGGTDWGTADLALRRFTDATDQQSITFHGGSAQITYGANQHNFNSAVHAPSYVTTSTRESKEDITYLSSTSQPAGMREGTESLVDRFKKLKPVSYNPKAGINNSDGEEKMKVNPRRKRLHSFVAEEAALAVPEIVSFDEEGKPEGIDLNATSVMQTLVIQELIAKVEALENRLLKAERV